MRSLLNLLDQVLYTARKREWGARCAHTSRGHGPEETLMATAKKRRASKKKPTLAARIRADYAKLKKDAAAHEKKVKADLAAHKKKAEKKRAAHKKKLAAAKKKLEAALKPKKKRATKKRAAKKRTTKKRTTKKRTTREGPAKKK